MAAQGEVTLKKAGETTLFGNDELMFQPNSLIVALALDKMPE